MCAADLIWSQIFRKFPNLQIALSEGGIGWIPYFLDRIDFTYQHHKAWTHQDFGDKLPSQVFHEHIVTCFIDDPAGLKLLDDVGIDMVTWECDYPHSDSAWPHAPEVFMKQLGRPGRRRHQQDHARERDAHLPVRPVRAPRRRSSARSARCAPRRATSTWSRAARGRSAPTPTSARSSTPRRRCCRTTDAHHHDSLSTAFARRNWRRNESSGVVSGLRRAGETRGRAAVGHGSDPIDDVTTFWELLERRAERTPDAPMLIDEHDRTVTFGECRAWTERVAAGLVGLGVTADTPVAWQLPTRIESIVLSFALARLGTTQLPIIPIYREREVGSVLVAGWRPVLRSARHLAQLRLRGDGEGPAGQHRRAVRDPRGRPTRSPRATPPRCRRRPPTATPCAGSTRRRARPRRRSA